MTLLEEAQTDFSAGAFQGVERTLIPRNGLYAAANALVDNDGGIYKRGGSLNLSSANFNAAGLRFLLDAWLSAGQRTLFADAADFGVLDIADAPINLGGAGLSSPRRAAVIDGVAVIGGGAMYAGSRKPADYTTGTISTTQGSAVITGSGTTWNTLVDAGMFLRIGTERYYVVKSIDSTTQITLTEAYEGSTAAGSAYTLSPLATAPRTSSFYVTGFDRLISLENDEVRFSRARSAGETGMPPVGNSQWQTFDATDFHKLPGGVQIVGGYFLGGTLYVFTTGGVYAVGNMAYDLTDADGNAQQTLSRIAPDLVLWANEGIASWADSMIVPAIDGVWLFGPGGSRKLSRSIDARYLAHVRAGRKAGLAQVYRNHYLLPILSATNVPVETLVCRLDRPQPRTPIGEVFPWTWLTGAAGAGVTAFAVRVGAAAPKLLGASSAAAARVLDCSGFFEPTGGNEQDHDGSNFEWDITTRDYQVAALNVPALVRRLRIRYELEGAASISAWCSIGVAASGGVALWDTALWDTGEWASSADSEEFQLSGQAPPSDGRLPFPYKIDKRTRTIRFRLRSPAPTSKLTLHNLELFTRATQKR